jgi:hypothetical protein
LRPHAGQGGLDGLVAGPRSPDALLRAEVEDPGSAVGPPQEGIAEVELARLGLAAAAVLGMHLGIAVAEAGGDAGAHRALAVAAVGQVLGVEAVGEQVARDEGDGHVRRPRRLPLRGCVERRWIITSCQGLSQVGCPRAFSCGALLRWRNRLAVLLTGRVEPEFTGPGYVEKFNN